MANLLLVGSINADSLVVQTCGTLPLAYQAGATRLDTVDVNGNKCTNAGSAGANQNVNINQILGAAVSPANALPTKSGTYSSAGASQYLLSVTTATALTPPAGSTIAEICTEAAAVRYRDDGTAPTASTGMPVAAGGCFQYAGPLAAIQFIAQTASSTTIDVSYYK